MAPKLKQAKRSPSHVSKELATKPLPLSPTPPSGDFLTQEFFSQIFNDFTQRIEQFVLDLCGKIDAKIAQIKMDMFEAMSTLTDYTEEMENKLETLEEANFNLTSNIQTLQQEIRDIRKQLIMINYNRKASAIRIRGLPERKGENLKQTFVEAFSQVVGSPGLNFDWNIRKIYCQNSCVAEQRQLPRDIIIYFFTKDSRNAIIQKFYNNRLRIDGQDLFVFKEIPYQMLQERRGFAFLTKELRNQQIKYKWEVPAGITVTLENQRFHLNSVSEARDFYYKTLKAGLPDPLGYTERQGEGKISSNLLGYKTKGVDLPLLEKQKSGN